MWRLKWKPVCECDEGKANNSFYLGAASMHNGSGIYKIQSSSSNSDNALTMTTVETQIDDNATRLVYGMDWLHKEKGVTAKKEMDETNPSTTSTVFNNIEADATSAECSPFEYEIATCSFYDNLVQIWCR